MYNEENNYWLLRMDGQSGCVYGARLVHSRGGRVGGEDDWDWGCRLARLNELEGGSGEGLVLGVCSVMDFWPWIWYDIDKDFV